LISEAIIQKDIVKYLEDSLIGPFTATCGGVYCSKAQRMKVKALGYKKGVPDLLIFIAKGPYNGLCIEVKTRKGRITPEQRRWHEALSRNGYKVLVPRSFEEAKCSIDEYMKL
jgi:hypothetical protein